MAIGTSLFLIAVGAILRYAITDSINGIDLATVGLILLVVGVIGLVLSFIQLALVTNRRRADHTYPPRDRDVY